MKALALGNSLLWPNVGAVRRPSSRIRSAALAFVVFCAVALPDCCLNGSHRFGAGMDSFGAICRAAKAA